MRIARTTRPIGRAPLTAAVVLTLAGALAGCGSTPAPAGHRAAATGLGGPALATTVASSTGASWAVVEMGGSAAGFNNFWELFARPAGSASWKLVTPAGVASNGGLVTALAGASAAVTAFRPSQDLTFSPLAASTDAGRRWSQNDVLAAGLADLPEALAGNASGQLLALTDAGAVLQGAHLGATWSALTSEKALASSAEGRGCGLTALTAVGWSPAGAPIVAGDCSRSGVAGIFTLQAGRWRAAGPILAGSAQAGSVTGKPISVLGLATTRGRSTAVLAVGTGPATRIVAAWSTTGGVSWRTSPPLPAPALPAPRSASAEPAGPSVSFGADGSASLVLAGQRGAVIGWLAPAWQTLPALPARTTALATTPAGRPEALAAKGGTLTAWLLPAGGSAWTLEQTVHVTIPYGSSS